MNTLEADMNSHPMASIMKHTTIVNYASSFINKLEALLTDNAGVIIYNCYGFIVQATDLQAKSVIMIITRH